ncbi:MAG: hypothetical protein ACO3CQ_00910 [Candidatus Nanopelagicaceae bacterium]
MGLSRLSNFLKNVKGNIIYVDPNSLDSTDSTENQGNSLTRPFKTIQRALIEAARFSYQRGKRNDRFLKTTILLYPGEHYIDNRPGWIPSGQDVFTIRNGLSINASIEWDFQTNFDIFDSSNDLYKLNSVYGGVIVPRGTSIVGMDLRKTKLRPLYIPNPELDEISRTALFRVTGGCYFWQFTILDGDPNGFCFKDYTSNQTVPNYSHHKLTVFEYADGINPVKIDDDFLTYSTDRSDLEIYYQKVGLVYGQGNGRPISPDYPEEVDIDPVVDEYRVVGTKGLEVGITSIRSGNGIVGTTEITVFLDSVVDELSVDTPIQIRGVSEPGYVGQYAVAEVIDAQSFKYIVSSVPDEINPDASGATLNITVDTVSSASPYIFNCSLRSVFGMCGLHADGNSATGFKSMVVAQYTGIGLQKDDKAFVRYDKTSGIYIEGDTGDNSHNNSLSRFKPEYENYHIKASNNAFLQLVSVFAIGFANHFLAESGGDHSITNSNSNFGAKSLVSKGFRNETFVRDDCGYITHIVTPKAIDSNEETISFLPIDITKTVTTGDPSKLYLYNEKNRNNPPNIVLDGYRIGGSINEKLYLQIIDPTSGPSIYSADVVMGGTENNPGINAIGRNIYNIQGEKKYRVGRSSSGINTIANNTFFMNEEHSFKSGESVYVVPVSSGGLPDGIKPGVKYYTSVLDVLNPNTEFKLSTTEKSAELGTDIVSINNKGGILDIISRSVDKLPGQTGSSVQWDGTQWYVVCNPVTNSIFSKLDDLYPNTSESSSKTFIKRIKDNRDNTDKIYKLRYVIPKENLFTCRPPLDGYIIQESSSTGLSDSQESSLYFATGTQTLTNPTSLRNPKFISNSSWGSNLVTITTELPHDLKVGSEVTIYNIVSTNNLDGSDNLGYNGTFTVFSVLNSKQFTYTLKEDPGTFGNDVNQRLNPDLLPRFVNRSFRTTYQIYKTEEIQQYEQNSKDGIYYLTVTNCSNNPSVTPFTNESFSQPIQYLYPQLNRDNPESNPEASVSFALPDPIGEVSINDPRRSITKETLNKSILDLNIGIGITDITSSSGTAHTIYTEKEHNLNSITNLNISNAGQYYQNGTYYNIPLVSAANSTTGANATAIITISTGGAVSSIRIMDGGSAYGIGNTLTPVGLTTLPNSLWTPANTPYFTVTGINTCVGSVLSISGISTHNDVKFPGIKEYNLKYIISSIPVGNTKSIIVQSEKTIPNYLSRVGQACNNAIAVNIGTRTPVSSIQYTPSTGIATVGFTTSHTYRVGSLISLYGANDSFYNNKKFYVTELNSQLSVRVDMGKSTNTPTSGGTIFALPSGFESNRGDIIPEREIKSARLMYYYDNFKTNVRTQLNSNSSSDLEVYSISNSGLKVGDYLLVSGSDPSDSNSDSYEIMRIAKPVTGTQINVIRGLLGTKRKTHIVNDVVERIKIKPVEFRRNSIIRASGHTFEYLGFGPGNYSTGLPERQDRILSPQEEILSQSTKVNGGTILYSAMNSDGDFYNNNRKLTSSGKDQIFETPIPTVSGEEPLELITEGGYNLVTSEETIISRSLKVSGGSESNLISEFNGPVVFNKKISSNSEDGVEVKKISLKGELNIPREIGISTSIPILPGTIGDVTYNASPKTNSNVGWIYTEDDKWEQFGWVNDELYGVVAGVGNDLNISQTLQFAGSGIVVSNAHDSSSGVTTVTFSSDFEAANQIGLVTGTDSQTYPDSSSPGGNWIDLSSGTPVINSQYQVPFIKFVGSDVGFGFQITSEYGFVNGVGVGTVKFESPLRPLNFGRSSNLVDYPSGGLGLPTLNTLSLGTRIILDNTLNSGSTNYAIGRNSSDLWFSTSDFGSSIPSGYRFYTGTTQLAYLASSTVSSLVGGGVTFSVFGDIYAYGRSGSNAGDIIASGALVSRVTGANEPVSVASSFLCDTLNVAYLNGYPAGTANIQNSIPVRTVDSNVRIIEGVSVQPNQVVIAGVSTGLIDNAGFARNGAFYQNILNITGYQVFRRDGDYSSGVSTFTNICEITNVIPTTATPDANGILTVDYRNGAVARYSGNGFSNFSSLNITNVPGSGGVAANRSFNFTLIVDPATSTTLPNALRIDNTNITNLRWLNGNKPPSSGNSSGLSYVVGFTITVTTSGTTALGVYSSYN